MSKIVDTAAIMQVIGNIYNNPSLLDASDKYHFYNEDFIEDFHKVLFGSIFNLHQLGAREINAMTIEDYLRSKPKSLAIYRANKGSEYIIKIAQNAKEPAFDFYYNRMKKMTLLRMYNDIGIDITDIYDVDNIFDIKKRQMQDEWLDKTTLEDIADRIDKKILDVRLKYAGENSANYYQAGEGIGDLIEELRKNPDIGIPMYGDIINTITRGARLSKFYLRSAPTGVGKTRLAVADACHFACDEMYDIGNHKWIKTGSAQPTMFIATEQNLSEIQTAILAFISGVSEERILVGAYENDEYDRVKYAAEVVSRAPLHIKELPDFSLQDIENCIKFAVREWDVKYVVYDYLHSSMKILGEVASKTKVANLREDNILFMISSRLKDLCNQYGIFILTATQLNGSWQEAEIYNEGLLRGAKAIADRIDLGMMIFNVQEKDKDALLEICSKTGLPMPDMKLAIYKNRRGRWKDILLWCTADKGTCRVNPVFATDYEYQLIKINNMKIEIKNG